MNEIFASLGIFSVLFFVLVSVLWFILPFAVFRIRKESIAQTKLLQKIAANTFTSANK